jgi:hypothetical protein
MQRVSNLNERPQKLISEILRLFAANSRLSLYVNRNLAIKSKKSYKNNILPLLAKFGDPSLKFGDPIKQWLLTFFAPWTPQFL